MAQKRNIWRKGLSLLLAVSLLGAILLGGCNASDAAKANDVLTQKQTGGNRQKVSVLVKYAFSVNAFEAAVEEKFPDLDLVQVGNYTGNMGVVEYESRLEHDDLTDIVMTWPLKVGEEYWADRLLDLSPFEFTSKYNLSMLNDMAKDGKLYYLPGPSQMRGIVYNKTLFAERGWQVPSDFDGFLSLCETIEKSGMRSLQLGLGNAEVLDTAFVGYGYANSFSQPQDTQWLQNYNAGQNSFGEHFMPALDTFQMLIDAKVLRPKDLQITYADRENMLFTRACAMIEDSVLMARMGQSQTGTTDEFALMPFFNPDDGGDWTRLYMVCYIGLNKHLAEPAQKEKYDLVLDIMRYISTSEGQAALMGDTGAMFSSLTGVAPSDTPEIEALLPSLKAGRYAIFPQLEHAQGALRAGLAGMVRGDMSKDEVIKLVDAQNVAPPIVTPPAVCGTAEKDFTLLETGNFITDQMRQASGSEIALFLDNGKDGRFNGKGVSGSLYQGDVTEADIKRILPDFKHGERGILCTATITGANLITALEETITVNNNETGWFYYFSGLRMEYDPTAAAGSRIHSIVMADGTAIEEGKHYTLALADESVSPEHLNDYQESDQLIADLLKDAVRTAEIIKPSNDNRFTLVQN